MSNEQTNMNANDQYTYNQQKLVRHAYSTNWILCWLKQMNNKLFFLMLFEAVQFSSKTILLIYTSFCTWRNKSTDPLRSAWQLVTPVYLIPYVVDVGIRLLTHLCIWSLWFDAEQHIKELKIILCSVADKQIVIYSFLHYLNTQNNTEQAALKTFIWPALDNQE